MDAKEIINAITERVKDTANVRVVFGDPVDADGVKVIPVAKVKISGGGGGGMGQAQRQEEGKGGGHGLGLGLWMITEPLGYIEVKDGNARLVPIVDKGKLLLGGMILTGLLLLSINKMLRKCAWKKKKMMIAQRKQQMGAQQQDS